MYRRFKPYFKYLRKVRVTLALGVLCGVLYGVAGGLGVPVMIKYVIPRVLLPDAPRAEDPSRGDRMRKFFDLDKFFDRLAPLPQAEAAAPAAPAAVPAAARPTLSEWQVWAIALWLPLIFVIRGVAGYLNTYLIQLSGVRILRRSAWITSESSRACRSRSSTACRRASSSPAGSTTRTSCRAR